MRGEHSEAEYHEQLVAVCEFTEAAAWRGRWAPASGSIGCQYFAATQVCVSSARAKTDL